MKFVGEIRSVSISPSEVGHYLDLSVEVRLPRQGGPSDIEFRTLHTLSGQILQELLGLFGPPPPPGPASAEERAA